MPMPWTPPAGWTPDWESTPMAPPAPLSNPNAPGWWDFLGPYLRGPAPELADEIDVVWSAGRIELWPAAGDKPGNWVTTDPPGTKLLPDGRDFTLFKRDCPHVRWERWLFRDVTIEYWRIDRSNPTGEEKRVLVDSVRYTFGEKLPDPPVYTQDETEYIWVWSSVSGMTIGGFWGVGVDVGLEVFVGGDVGHHSHGTSVPVKPRPSVPSRPGLTYNPEDELHGDPEKLPPNTQGYYQLSMKPLGSDSKEAEVFLDGRRLGVVSVDRPLRVPKWAMPDPYRSAWPPRGFAIDAPVQPPGVIGSHLLRGGGSGPLKDDSARNRASSKPRFRKRRR